MVEPSKELLAAARRFHKATEEVEAARAALADAIVADAAAGVRQGDIVSVTGYKREWVRRITRAGE